MSTYKVNPFTNFSVNIEYCLYDPVHDGYCSDAGPDEGEEVTERTMVKLRKNTVLALKELNAVNKDGSISKDILIFNNKDNVFKDILKYNNDKVYCTRGSGYCGYTGYCHILSITLNNPYKKYLVQLDDAN